MNIGDRVKIIGTDTIWDGKEGVLESIEDDEAIVFVDFIPEENKKVRNNFKIENIQELEVNESLNKKHQTLQENNMKKIYEIDWNGKHYTFEREIKRTGTKTHDILTMEDEIGSKWVGETTWVNRPWHRFDLEEAFVEIVGKAFGKGQQEKLFEINKTAHDVTEAIDKFFAQLKPEDIEAGEDVTVKYSEDARREALAKYLKVDLEDVEQLGKNDFSVNGEEYEVYTDKEADEEFDRRVRNLWDDLGFELFGKSYLGDWVLEYAINDSELEDYVREDIDNFVYDLDEDQLVSECIDEGIVKPEDVYDEESDVMNPEYKEDLDFDDLREKLIELRFNEIDNYAEYLRDLGYDDEFFKDFIDNELVIDAIKDDIDVNGSGRGQELAYYDSEEHDLGNGLFAYRVN